MVNEELAYFRLRAEAERAQARQATHPGAAAIHRRLASAYLKRIASAQPTQSSSHA